MKSFETLLDAILSKAQIEGQAPFPVVSDRDLEVVHKSIGIELPPLLSELYTQVGNGGFGPGLDGMVGVSGGAQSEFGGLIETYQSMDSGHGVIPLFSFGCVIWGCIDAESRIVVYEDLELWPQEYTLEVFLWRWVNGEPLFEDNEYEMVKKTGTNPRTGKPIVYDCQKRVR